MTLSPDHYRHDLLKLFAAALDAVNGRRCVNNYFKAYPLHGRVHLIAIGKAAVSMTQGAVDVLGRQIINAFIVTKYGYADILPWPCHEAGHPIPDIQSLEAGRELIKFVLAIPKNDQVLVLLSGGASALVEKLPVGVNLDQLIEINQWLLASGLDIKACNAVRRRVSLIKGGRLAGYLSPRPTLCLAISDVPGDDPEVIGSGPLVPPKLENHLPPIPPLVAKAIECSSPRPTGTINHKTRVEVIATLEDAKQAAAAAAAHMGYSAYVYKEFVEGDAVAVGEQLAKTLMKDKSGTVRIWGGETTVILPPSPGRGGRNQQLALAAAMYFAGSGGIFLLAAGSDGTDGPGTDAGALVDSATVARGEAAGLMAEKALARADAGSFLAASGDLIHTGPTGTNVMDIVLGLRL